MDSLTQVVLGGAVGEAVLGRKLGSRAIVVGAVAGTIPDLDVIGSLFLDPASQLVFHRSVTHSLIFAVLAAPILGAITSRLFSRFNVSWKRWGWLFFFAFLTHILIDACTNYGTQLLWPFDVTGFAWNTVFVIDPLYTVPLLIALIVAMLLRRQRRARRLWVWSGLLVSTLYIVTSFSRHSEAEERIELAFSETGLQIESIEVMPTALNTLFWRGLLQTEQGVWEAYVSTASSTPAAITGFAPRDDALLDRQPGSDAVRKLAQGSRGFFYVRDEGRAIIWNDLRFGGAPVAEIPEALMTFRLEPNDQGDYEVSRSSYDLSGLDFSEAWRWLWRAMWHGYPTSDEESA